MPPKYKLIYFNAKGFGETARMVFAQAGVEYEDFRFDHEEWPKHKPNTPFGQVPVLEVDGGFQVADSQAIARYLAKEFGMAGKNNQEEALVNMYAAALYDLSKPSMEIIYAPEDKKADLTKKFIEETAPKFLNRFESTLAANKSGFLVGDGVTWVDFVMFNFIPWFQTILTPKHFDKYTNIKAHQGKIENLPKIKEWIQKRPVTER